MMVTPHMCNYSNIILIFMLYYMYYFTYTPIMRNYETVPVMNSYNYYLYIIIIIIILRIGILTSRAKLKQSKTSRSLPFEFV